ncbi:MAG: Xaa-Pro peptidase family protein [Candidatus Glassbacteria bacterium]
MKSEIGGLLERRGVDVLWVSGASSECPDTYYLTGGVSLTAAWIILTPERGPLLVHGPMEREAAAAGGLRTLDFDRLGAGELSRTHNDPLTIKAEMFARLAELENLRGRLAVHGTSDPGEAHFLIQEIARRVPSLAVTRDLPPVLESARATKDEGEIGRMRAVAEDTLGAIAGALELVRRGREKDGIVVGRDEQPVTVGRVRRALREGFAARNLIESHDTILAFGAQAGIPHASSPDEEALPVGQTVVLDVFPRRGGGGYFFDITRSFCIGRASEEALELYNQVLEAQQEAIDSAAEGIDGNDLQAAVCSRFERLGHPTQRTQPGTTAGYVHSLGHGIGLEIHEHPYLKLQDAPDERNRLKKGSVFTIEPGLYYPDRGLGVRIEDVVYVNDSGRATVLAPFDKFPVLPLEG